MRAMRAKTEDVLQQYLVVGRAGARLVGGELQPDAAELGRAPVGHHAVAARVVLREQQWRLHRRQTGGDVAMAQPVVAVAHAPARHELVHGLRIPARLPAGVIARRAVEIQIAVLGSPEVFALQLEVGHRRVAVRRPFRDEVRDPHGTAPAERQLIWLVLERALARRGAQVRQSRAPRGRFADVTADMAEQVPQADAIAVRVTPGEAAPAPELGAELDQEIRRRDPLELHPVVVEPPPEERLVRQRRILEIPGVLMDLVLVADAGKEAPALQREAAPERERLEERLLDLERVFGRERSDYLPAEIRIDVRADDELGFAEAEAARRRAH